MTDAMQNVGLDFIVWLDRGGNFSPVIMIPAVRAARDIAEQALKRGAHHGRITLWLWRGRNNTKMAVAMARIGGDGGERPVKVIRGAPPYRDDDKAEVIVRGERQ